MGQLDGKVCVVTGAAGSIGLASARVMLAEGALVMLVDIDPGRLQGAMADLGEYGERAAITAADVADTDGTRGYIDAAVGKWGKIDVIFSNAGASGEMAPITEYPEEVFDRVMAVNVRASFLACKYGLPQMNDGGSIIITSSIMGVQANPNIVAYATSKHAVVGLMRTVAKEAAARGIRVNVIAPGPVDNEFQTDIEDRLSAVIGIDATEMINQAIPLKRHASADEIAGTVLFLASDQSSFSTGAVFMVDGGLNA
ncbi:MAG: SDR family NAD(P)-dependent oxidoreductase [Rhodospirillales bacterium]|jgi:NAD(P)-dependent dehydrogenase (short-subunit alcohol dehydrogenase family)|nr:short-chain dehydrogenase [Rhodospirillaceae bacterium]MDP6428899.1 SDR family NAD(P)-dependent oxidoreductase [Rhodospirillales bacterium]MDP6644728.1 SDR family NAD(P)-dependent oxidoreductase [Rhodospirillales bacterium]MDP6840460.1 SDR family NAD(P)-dependent oxidoreductase [Rhodospirillales bacterium]